MKHRAQKPTPADPSDIEPTDRTVSIAALSQPCDGEIGECDRALLQCLRLISRVESALHSIEAMPDAVGTSRALAGLAIARESIGDMVLLRVLAQ